jgi:hypothetical protein
MGEEISGKVIELTLNDGLANIAHQRQECVQVVDRQ